MGRILAIDYGDQRIGLALSDPLKIIATPYKTIINDNDDYSVNSQATVIVNYVDDRVRARGLDVLPDIIEQIPLTIDFVYSREIELDSSMLKISLEVRNLLNEEYEATMANSNIFYDQYELGTSISLGFKLNF